MKLGAFFLCERPREKTDAQVFRELIEQVQLAESLGYDSVWLAQHHFSEYGIAGSLPTVAAAVARETERVRVGTAVSILPFQHPVHLAEDWATVDVLSGGRLNLGVGRGYQPTEFDGFNVAMNESTRRFDESVEILRLAWTQDRFSYEGAIYQVKDLAVFPKPVQQPHPPLWVAALQPASYERIGRLGLGIMAAPLITPIPLVKGNLEVYRQAYRDSGHGPELPEFPMQLMVYVAETNEQAQRDAARYFEWYYQTIARLVARGQDLPAAEGYKFYAKSQVHLGQVKFQDLWDGRTAAVGDPARVASILEEYRRELGMDHLMAWVGVGGMPHDKVVRSMRLLAEEVFPKLGTTRELVKSA